MYPRPLVKSVYLNNFLISYFSAKTYVMSTQKNRLNETVLLSTKTCVQTNLLKISLLRTPGL